MTFVRPEIIRPPSEHGSYFLPLTSGCSNNTCAFCCYHGSKLRVRELDDVQRELDAVSLYMEKGIYTPGTPEIVYAIAQRWDGRQIFLQDGDALVYPLPKLKQVLRRVNERLPSVERVAAYATAQDILRIAPDDLRELRELKLGILYVGLESGDDKVLKRIGKGATTDQVIEAGVRAKQAGMLTSITVLLGLGGVEGSEEHALKTAEALNRMDPDYVGALTLTLVPGTPLYEAWRRGDFRLITPLQSLGELLLMVEHSNFSNCFFSSMHASNYFAIRGWLPREKGRMVAELKRIIASGDQSMLRPEFLRGL